MADDGKKLFKWHLGSNYLALPRDPQPWLIRKLVPSGGLMNIFSRPKIGKSFWALGAAIAISNPDVQKFCGQDVLKHGHVMYLQIDTPRNDWANRIQVIKTEGHSIENIRFVDAMLTPYPLDINVLEVKSALKADIEEYKPVMLVVDTLREVHDGDENDSKEMKRVITSIVECTMPSSCTVLFVSHSRKDNAFGKNGHALDDEDTLMDDGRGSSYVSGRMDVVSKLTAKGMLLQGRSIGKTRIVLEQHATNGLWDINPEKAEAEGHLKYVMEQPDLSQRQRAELLCTLIPELKIETARSRIRDWVDKNGAHG